MSATALQGATVVSVALNLPGPAALMRLRGMGARCIKLEPPAGDPMRAACPQAYAQLHQGVEVLTADLKSEAGRATLHRLLAGADVLLASFRPAALARLGLDWAGLHAAHPALGLVSIVGAPGADGDLPGHDLTYTAEAGLLPALDMPATLVADMAGALMASEAVLRAVLAGRLGGEGVRLEVALSQAAGFAALPLAWGLTAPGGLLGGGHAGYRVYACADGRVAMAALEPHFFERLRRVAGLPEGAAPEDASSRSACAAFLAGLRREQIEALAAAHDLPLFTLA